MFIWVVDNWPLALVTLAGMAAMLAGGYAWGLRCERLSKGG